MRTDGSHDKNLSAGIDDRSAGRKIIGSGTGRGSKDEPVGSIIGDVLAVAMDVQLDESTAIAIFDDDVV